VATIHNALKYSTELIQSIGAVLGLGDEEEGTVRQGETLTPVYDVFALPEVMIRRGELLWGRGVQVAAVAAENAFAGIRNPAGSGMSLVVEAADSSTLGLNTQVMIIQPTSAADVDSVGQVVGRDTRGPAMPTTPLLPITQVAFILGTSAGIAGTTMQRTDGVAGAIIQSIVLPIVLSPGFEIRLFNANVNVTTTFTLAGRVRPYLPGEETP
jgi:hypothetical protein